MNKNPRFEKVGEARTAQELGDLLIRLTPHRGCASESSAYDAYRNIPKLPIFGILIDYEIADGKEGISMSPVYVVLKELGEDRR
jgi:hypothetical protein